MRRKENSDPEFFVRGYIQSETAQPEDELLISYEIAKFDKLPATTHSHYHPGFLRPSRSAGSQQSHGFAKKQHTGKQQNMGLVPRRQTARPSSSVGRYETHTFTPAKSPP